MLMHLDSPGWINFACLEWCPLAPGVAVVGHERPIVTHSELLTTNPNLITPAMYARNKYSRRQISDRVKLSGHCFFLENIAMSFAPKISIPR